MALNSFAVNGAARAPRASAVWDLHAAPMFARAAVLASVVAYRWLYASIRAGAVASQPQAWRWRWAEPLPLFAQALANEPHALVNADHRALDGRGFDVPLQIRGLEVPAQQRELAVATQIRVLPLPGQDRTLEVAP